VRGHPLAHHEARVVLVAEQRHAGHEALRVYFRCGSALDLGAALILQHDGDAAHLELVIRRVGDAEIDHRGGALLVERSGADLEDLSGQLDMPTALHVDNNRDGDRDDGDADRKCDLKSSRHRSAPAASFVTGPATILN